jgi:DNA-binding CsgD family transcriptional regulator
LLLEEALAAPVEPRAIAFGLLAILRALTLEGRPLLVAIDDVQWVDPATAMALSFALRRAVENPIGVLLSQRQGSGVEPRLELEPSVDLERVVVGPLSLGALRRLLEDRLDVSLPRPILGRIHARARGNPFFALELARALQARGGRLSPQEDLPVPDDLERLVAERLRLLPPGTMAPLAAVAALREPTVGLLGEETLKPALAAGVLVLEGDRIRFDHPMIAAAAYEALSLSSRRALHRRLATMVQDSEEHARHLALGAEGPDAALATVLDAAARAARARGAPEAAADLAEWALRLGDQDEKEVAARRSVAAAEYRWLAGDHRRARELIEAALSADAVGAARARLLLLLARIGDQSTDAALALMREALGDVGSDERVEAEILAELARSITDVREPAAAEPYARRCLELAERVGDPVLLSRALLVLAMNQFWLGRGFDRELTDRALELDPRCESMPIARRAMAVVGLLCAIAGDVGRARTLLQRARQIGCDRADPTVYIVLWLSAAVEYLADNWRRSLELAQELYELGIQNEHEPSVLRGLCARAGLLAHLGEEDQTRRDVGEAVVLDKSPRSGWTVRFGWWALSVLELSQDRPAAALEYARAITADLRAEGVEDPAVFNAFPIHAEAAIACGELVEAEQLLDWIEERAVRLDREWALACSARCRGLLAAVHGDEAGARRAFERALAEHKRVQYRRFDLARTLLAQGETLRRFKKKALARDALTAATAIFDELGARLWSTKARLELARISGRARADSLTETEGRVADLAAAGHSNKQIASELFVAVRTVETHLTKAYAKLGVRSRMELASRRRG